MPMVMLELSDGGGGATKRPTEGSGATISAKVTGTNNVSPQSLIPCYVVNMITNDKVVFPAYPSDLTEGHSIDYTPTAVMGRSAPYFAYGGNGARTVSYSITLHDDICENLLEVVDKLRALAYPVYKGSIVIPPYVHVLFGDMVKMYAVLDGIDFTWGETVIGDNKHLSKVEVNFSFNELRLKSLPTATGTFNEG